MSNAGAFTLYDTNRDGVISHSEMLDVTESIYRMVGSMVKLPEDEDSPIKVVGGRSLRSG